MTGLQDSSRNGGLLVELNSVRSKLLLGVVCGALALAYFHATYSLYRADVLSTRPEPASLRQASARQPGNAEYHYQIALQEFFGSQDANAALAEFASAVRLNPTAASYWLGMATAYQVIGDEANEERCLRRAVEADPTTPDIAWRAAMFHVVRGDLKSALPLFRVVVANDPANASPALATCWRATRDARLIMEQALPLRAESYLTFIDVLTAADEPAVAQMVWGRLVEHKLSVEPRLAFPYLWYLYQHHDSTQARRVWQQLAVLNREFATYVSADDLVTNGGFERDILDGAFDWHFTKVAGVQVILDSSSFHAGTRSLSLTYQGGSVGPAGIEQVIPVEPGTAYEFSAFERSEELVSASGPRLLLSDAFTGKQYVLTDDISGTQAWRQVHHKFVTAPDARYLILRIVRSPAEPLITGTFWVDDVSLIRQ